MRHTDVEVEAYFIVDTVGKHYNKVVGGPMWTELEAEVKLDKMRKQAGDDTRFRIRSATMTIHFKPDEE
jgi:hypothetical protein